MKRTLLASVAALAVTTSLSATSQAQNIGTAGAVNPSTTASGGGGTRQLNLGSQVIFRERVATSASGSVQVTFIDKSTLNIGRNSEVVIDEFVFNPNTGDGRAAISLGRGALRFVGGAVSKNGNAEVRTPVATVGIRGGVAIVSHTPQGGTQVVNVFGRTTIATANGVQTISRPGFAVTAQPGSAPQAPVRVAQGDLDALNRQTTSAPAQSGGRSSQPTDTQTASSGVARANAGVTAAGIVPVQANNASRSEPLTALAASTPGLQAGNPITPFTAGATATTAAQATTSAQSTRRVATPRAFALTMTNASGSRMPYLLGSFVTAGNVVVTPVYGYRVGGDGVTGDRTRFLQAGLVINGQGAGQTNTLMGANGDFFFNQGEASRGNPGYTFAGGFFASSRFAANQGPNRASGNITSTPGTMTLDADQLPVSFNVDSNEYIRATGQTVPGTVSASNLGQYTYSQQAAATTPPAGLGENRNSNTLVGFIGGVLRSVNFATVADFNGSGATATNTGPGYRVRSNNLSIQFEPDRSTVMGSADLGVVDTGATPLRGVRINLGRNPNDPTAAVRSAYVDNDTWLVRAQAQSVGSGNDQLDTTTFNTTFGSNQASITGNRQLLVPWSLFEKQDPAGSRAFFPTVTQWNTYQHTQWGFWASRLDQNNASGGVISHRGDLNTWVAGVPTDISAMPLSGSGTFTGHAIASIRDNFAGHVTYVAGGNYTGTANFATGTKSLSITNLDGRNFSGTGSGAIGGNFYSGTLTGTGGLTGSFQGRFYGPGAPETGGQFDFSGTNYVGSGIFIGRR